MRPSRTPSMRALLLAGALCAVTPDLAVAIPVTPAVSFGFDSDSGACGYMFFAFGHGLPSAQVHDSIDNTLGSCTLPVGTPNGTFLMSGVALDLVTGSLIDIAPYPSTPAYPDRIYTYAPGGSVQIDFDLLLTGGAVHHGTFVASLGTYVINANGPALAGSTRGGLGPGLFDSQTARLFGIRPQTLSGEADLWLDTSGSYLDPVRQAAMFGDISMTVVPVPEPSLMWLAAIAGSAVVARSRRRVSRRRTGTSRD